MHLFPGMVKKNPYFCIIEFIVGKVLSAGELKRIHFGERFKCWGIKKKILREIINARENTPRKFLDTHKNYGRTLQLHL